MRRATTVVGDLSGLPDHAHGAASLGWWGVVGFLLIAGMGFVLAIGAYCVLLADEGSGPPANPPLPWATLFTLLALLSEAPNRWVEKRAERHDLAGVRVGLVLMVAIGLALLVVRAFEFAALDVRWHTNAYGSIVWAILALHTLHTATGVYAGAVRAALVFVEKADGRRLSNVAGHALYWRFVVCSWVVLYGVVYWTPRWL